MKTFLLRALSCAVPALFILPVFAEGSSASTPVTDTTGSPLVDALALLLAAVILCGVIFLFYRVLHPKSKEDQPQNRRLKRR